MQCDGCSQNDDDCMMCGQRQPACTQRIYRLSADVIPRYTMTVSGDKAIMLQPQVLLRLHL